MAERTMRPRRRAPARRDILAGEVQERDLPDVVRGEGPEADTAWSLAYRQALDVTRQAALRARAWSGTGPEASPPG